MALRGGGRNYTGVDAERIRRTEFERRTDFVKLDKQKRFHKYKAEPVTYNYQARPFEVVYYDPTNSTLTITAPLKPQIGDQFRIKNVSASNATITIAGGNNPIVSAEIPYNATNTSISFGKEGFGGTWEYDGTRWEPISHVANDLYAIVLSIQLHGTELNSSTSAFWMIGSPLSPFGAYTIRNIEHMLTTAGATTSPVYTLQYGNHTDGFTTIKSGITPGTANGQTAESGFTTAITTSATRPNFFRLDQTTAGVDFVANDSWALSISVARDSGVF